MSKHSVEEIKAVILGHAVGDALGVPVEFQTREGLEADPVTDMRGYADAIHGISVSSQFGAPPFPRKLQQFPVHQASVPSLPAGYMLPKTQLPQPRSYFDDFHRNASV